ncbi:hypothetical protein AGMMS49942_02540 [Spirochaetia bacterium]|nr:hypothetical protein AGMMS49942_02540 [Spirochaetia bacterium]
MDTSKKMTSEEKFEYWLDIAQYDLKSAGIMYRSGRWLHVVFMCQQAIEKLVKGLFSLYKNDTVPHIHDIRAIFLKIMPNLTIPVDEKNLDFLSLLNTYYLNTRYPAFKEKLSSTLNKTAAKTTLKKTKEIFEWLLTLKP